VGTHQTVITTHRGSIGNSRDEADLELQIWFWKLEARARTVVQRRTCILQGPWSSIAGKKKLFWRREWGLNLGARFVGRAAVGVFARRRGALGRRGRQHVLLLSLLLVLLPMHVISLPPRSSDPIYSPLQLAPALYRRPSFPAAPRTSPSLLWLRFLSD